MKHLLKGLLLFVSLVSVVFSQEDYCLYFPLAMGMTWEYESNTYPYSKTAAISDTMSLNGHLYYKYGPHGADNSVSQYWLRPSSNTILALNPTDSSEYLLFNFSYEGPTTWDIPPVVVLPSSQPVNQCDWGTSITISNALDTVYTSNRTFYYPRGFAHGERPCFDAGIASTRFSLDFGLVNFFQITEGDGIDWVLVPPLPDTLTVSGVLTTSGNPCTMVPCLPGIVATLTAGDSIYFLTHDDFYYRSVTIGWHGIGVYPQDSISVFGYTTDRLDVFGDHYTTLEILELEHIETTSIDVEPVKMTPHRSVLLRNYPNPFNPSTSLELYVPDQGQVTLQIFDTQGGLIQTLARGFYKPGQYVHIWNGTDASGERVGSGVYFARLEVGNATQTIKLIFVQ